MFAHGYQTLLDDTEVLYQVSERYTQDRNAAFATTTRSSVWRGRCRSPLISDKDAGWPLLEPGRGAGMILVDTALARREQEGGPIRVGMIGAGFMGRACPADHPVHARACAGGGVQPASRRRRIEAYRDAGRRRRSMVAESAAPGERAVAAGRPGGHRGLDAPSAPPTAST